MAKFSKKSLDRLNQCDARLVAIFTEVVKVFDCTVLEGYRSEIEQNRLFEQGKNIRVSCCCCMRFRNSVL